MSRVWRPRQLVQRFGDERHEGVARVLAFQKCRHHQPVRERRRHILGGMDAEIDLAIGQCRLDFLGKQALATHFRQRRLGQAVAGGGDGEDFDGGLGHAMDFGEQTANQPGLIKRQHGAAAADAQEGRRLQCHRVPCSECVRP